MSLGPIVAQSIRKELAIAADGALSDRLRMDLAFQQLGTHLAVPEAEHSIRSHRGNVLRHHVDLHFVHRIDVQDAGILPSMAPDWKTDRTMRHALIEHHAIRLGNKPAGQISILVERHRSHLGVALARTLHAPLLHGSATQSVGQDGPIAAGHHRHVVEHIGGIATIR